MSVRTRIKKRPFHTKRTAISLFKVKPCNALLCILLVGIRIYVKSVLRYSFLILDTYRPKTLYLRKHEDPWLFFEAKRGPQRKTGKHWYRVTFIAKVTTSLSA